MDETQDLGPSYELQKDGAGRFTVRRDGRPAGEFLGRRGSWAVHGRDGVFIGMAASFQQGYQLLEAALRALSAAPAALSLA